MRGILKCGLGIPKHDGIHYAMGWAMVMEGLMSTAYHVCPTTVNFQFDTTYMHLLSIFMLLSLFKSRHPDVAPDAIAVFSLLAFSVSLGVFYKQNRFS